jgi:hypothetical protein
MNLRCETSALGRIVSSKRSSTSPGKPSPRHWLTPSTQRMAAASPNPDYSRGEAFPLASHCSFIRKQEASSLE